MPSITATGFRTLVASAFLVAVLGGIWRGVASCGGYAWHGQAMLVALAAAALSLVLFVPSGATSLSRRSFYALGVIGAFYAARAMSAPFYPAFPGFGAYIRQVGMALFVGPC